MIFPRSMPGWVGWDFIGYVIVILIAALLTAWIIYKEFKRK